MAEGARNGYIVLVAGAAVALVPCEDPRQQPRQDRRVLHTHSGPRRTETPEERQALLRSEAERMAARVEAHLESADPATRQTLLVAALPSVGKTRVVATLGVPTTAPLGELNLGGTRRTARHGAADPGARRLPTDRALHGAQLLGRRSVHAHSPRAGTTPGACIASIWRSATSARSSAARGSAVYQLAHVPTGYPAQHDGIVIDECNPSAWLPEDQITVGKLQAATAAVPTGSIADQLLRAVQATLTDATQAKTALTRRALFEALDRRCNGQLAAWLGALTQLPEVTDPHPWPGGLDITDPNAAQVAAALPPVVLPQLWRALAQEFGRWQAGRDWNSRLRIGQMGSGPEMALYLTQPRRFGVREAGTLPPRARLGRHGR